MYILLDTNLTAGYYLPRSLHSKKAANRIEILFDSVRTGKSDHFFYLPNFYVAEVFSVFMKHTFGVWNRHLKKKGTIDTRVYNSIVKQFQGDIHNGNFIYHYELSRYHVLAINLVAPIDHYFQLSKSKTNKKGKKTSNVIPMGTFDHLIIAMGIHLAHVHGRENVCIISTDDRLTNILNKCKSNIPSATIRKLKLDNAEEITGKKFSPDIFPLHLNFKTATIKEMKDVFGDWELPVGKVKDVYRWTKLD